MLDQEDIVRLQEAENNPSKFVVRGVSLDQKLGATTVVCFVLNRTIGSGIFDQPSTILRGTGAIGPALIIWAFTGVVAIAALLVWLTLAGTIPRFEVAGNEVSVPRSGGEKNFLEYIYRSPTFLTTCLIAVLYVALDNLAGNAIALGAHLTVAAGYAPGDPPKGLTLGIAIAALTFACLIHIVSRRGGIYLNNALAFMKVAILLLIIGLGLAMLGGGSFGHGKIDTDNFDTQTSFLTPQTNLASYATSMLYAYFCYSGFNQPFYVLAEVKNPRSSFAKASIGAMIGILILVVTTPAIINSDLDIALLLFQATFENDKAVRVMAGFIAISIFGNLIVMTFTAARVKQEIAKEGVLPFSRFLASNTPTLFAKIHSTMHRTNADSDQEELEHTPAAALLLHWVVSILLVAITAAAEPSVAYQVLTNLYTYTIALVVGFLVSVGLLYLMFRDRRAWTSICEFNLWGGPTAPILLAATTGFLIVTAFIEPSPNSPYSYETQRFEWYIVPTIGLGMLLLGVIYWAVFRFVVPGIMGKQLVVERVPIIVSDDHGGWVQKHEIVEFSWGVSHGLMDDDYDSEEK